MTTTPAMPSWMVQGTYVETAPSGRVLWCDTVIRVRSEARDYRRGWTVVYPSGAAASWLPRQERAARAHL